MLYAANLPVLVHNHKVPNCAKCTKEIPAIGMRGKIFINSCTVRRQQYHSENDGLDMVWFATSSMEICLFLCRRSIANF